MNTKEIALTVMKAWDEKDESTLRKHLHPNYVSIDPMMTIEGIDKAVEKMNAFPFKGEFEISHSIAEGNLLVVEGNWRIESPMKADIPLISLMKFEKDKLKEKRIYFDTGRLAK